MNLFNNVSLKRSLHFTTALIGLSVSAAALADAEAAADISDANTIVVTDSKATRSSCDRNGVGSTGSPAVFTNQRRPFASSPWETLPESWVPVSKAAKTPPTRLR